MNFDRLFASAKNQRSCGQAKIEGGQPRRVTGVARNGTTKACCIGVCPDLNTLHDLEKRGHTTISSSSHVCDRLQYFPHLYYSLLLNATNHSATTIARLAVKSLPTLLITVVFRKEMLAGPRSNHKRGLPCSFGTNINKNWRANRPEPDALAVIFEQFTTNHTAALQQHGVYIAKKRPTSLLTVNHRN